MAKLQVDISGNISSLEQSLNDANSKLADFGKQAEKVGKELSMKLTLPLVAFGAVSTKIFASFDDQMRKVGAISGATGEDLKRLTETAKEFGATTRFSATQSAEALEFLALAGFDATKSIEALPGVLNLAAAAAINLGSAADIVTDTMSAFGIAASRAGNVSDIFAVLQSKANTNVLQAGEAFKQAAPNARAFGQSIETTSALLGALADAGIKGGIAGTSLNAVMRDLLKSSENGAIAINGISVAIANADGSFRSMIDIIDDVNKATNGLTDIQKANALSNVFQAESLKGLNVLLGAGTTRLQELEGALINSTGASERMAAEMEGGIGGAMRSMRSALEGVSIVIGEILAPMVQKMANFIQRLATAFNGMSSTMQTVSVVVGAVAAAIGPVLLVIGKLISFIPTLVSGFKAVRIAMLAVTGPVGLIVAGVSLLATAIISNWDKIKAVLDSSGVTDAFNDFKVVIADVVSIAKDVFGALLVSVKQTFGGIIDFLKPVIAFFVEQFAKKIKAAITVITNIIGVFVDLIKGDFTGVLDRLKIIFLTLAVSMLESFRPIATFFGKGGAITTAIEGFSKVIEETQAKIKAKNPAKTIAEDAETATEEVKELVKTINTLPTGGTGTAKLATPTAIKGARTMPELTEFGKEIEAWKQKKTFEGMFDGMVLALAEVKTPLTDMLKELNEDIQHTVGQGIGNALSNMAVSLGAALTSGQNVIQALGGALLQSISGFLSQLGDRLIAFAIAAGAFSKLQLALANPATGVVAAGTALAAGIALKAMAGAIGSFGRSGGQGGQGSFGNTTSIIQPAQTNQPIRVVVEGQINGETIYLTQQAFQNRINRTLGGR